MFGSIKGLDLAKAECSSGCSSVVSGPLTVVAPGERPSARPCFGDDDIVVMVVVAVGGRSPNTWDIAESDETGNLPLSSSFRIRCLRSSTSSQIVDGAVVETVDSVSSPSCCRGLFPWSMACSGKGEE